jgi:hypothetical protein
MLAASPRQLGSLFNDVTYNAAYNRYGWALLALACLLLGLPSDKVHRRRALADGALVGLLLLCLFFIKATYFAAAVAVCVLALPSAGHARPAVFASSIAAVVVAGMVIVQAISGTISAYLADMATAAAVLANPLRLQQGLTLFNASAAGLLLVAVTKVVPMSGGGPLSHRMVAMIPALATAFAGIVVGMQNHLALENPLLVPAVVVAAFGLQRRTRAAPLEPAPAPAALVGASRIAVIGLLLLPLVQDASACVYTAIAPAAKGPAFAWLNETPLRGLRINGKKLSKSTDVERESLENDGALIEVLGDGVALLRREVPAGMHPTVLALTWSNPFPILMGWPPVRHELAWWDVSRTFTRTIKPGPERLLADVDILMIPKRYYNIETSRAMQEAYRGSIESGFNPRAESAAWTLWVRKNSAVDLQK